MFKLSSPLREIPGVGENLERKLQKLQLKTASDLLYHLPFRYEDFSNTSEIAKAIPGQNVTILGQIWQVKNQRTRRGIIKTECVVADETGTIGAVWFGKPYLVKNLKNGQKYFFSGQVKNYQGKLILFSPVAETSDISETIHTKRLVPIYPETRGLNSRFLRTKIYFLLKTLKSQINEFLPKDVLIKEKLPNLFWALQKIHFPKDHKEARMARQRLAFDEIFLIQLFSQIRKKKLESLDNAIGLKINSNTLGKFLTTLPFKLTASQEKSLAEILSDLAQKKVTNRILVGDVGTGKTIVAAICAFLTHKASYSTIFMAPTEILAIQHYKTLKEIFKKENLKIGLWTKSQKDTNCQILVGTHALIGKNTPKTKERVGLIVIDEQQRFGVLQRSELYQKIKERFSLFPNLLILTATPIPRTLLLTIWGEHDLSTLKDYPKGERKVKTFVVPPQKREDAYQFVKKHLKEGSQAFIICPLIESSETLSSVKAAKKEFERLKRGVFRKFHLDLIHGRLKAKEKETVLEKFKKSLTDILVATPVVEVGIDVENATIMIIEGADRFGLSQLHQMRGRVGRGKKAGFCLLFTTSQNPQSVKRLKKLEKIQSGLALSEIDLEFRGPGEILGTKQHGFPKLKAADLKNLPLIEKAKQRAQDLLNKDLYLLNHRPLKQKLIELKKQIKSAN